MTMPKAAMHETHRCEATEDEIRRSRQLSVMEAKSKSTSVKGAAKRQLGFRIPIADLRHHSRSLSSIHNVGHPRSYSSSRREHGPLSSQDPAFAIKVEQAIRWRSLAVRSSISPASGGFLQISFIVLERVIGRQELNDRCSFLPSRDLAAIPIYLLHLLASRS